MTDWKKTLREALKDTEGAYDKAISAFDNAGIKLQDVGSGDYTSTSKYNDDIKKYEDEVTKLKGEITSLKEAPNPLVDEIAKLKETHANDMAAEKAKVQGIIKSHAIAEKINGLGITNELEVLGMKSLIKADDIKMDDDYNITGGLDEQIESLKGTYKSSFETPKVVSTGQSLQTSQQNGGAVKQYGSLDEIRSLTQEQVAADLDNIVAQMSNLK